MLHKAQQQVINQMRRSLVRKIEREITTTITIAAAATTTVSNNNNNNSNNNKRSQKFVIHIAYKM